MSKVLPDDCPSIDDLIIFYKNKKYINQLYRDYIIENINSMYDYYYKGFCNAKEYKFFGVYIVHTMNQCDTRKESKNNTYKNCSYIVYKDGYEAGVESMIKL